MAIISTYCKKGGVGKTTLLGYLAHYYSQKGKKVLIISADDQNSIFKLFGVGDFITDSTDNYLENYLTGACEASDIVCEARDNMYIIKTLNTDRLSFTLTVKRQEERKIIDIIKDFTNYFDYIFVDFPPSSSRLSEVLLDISDKILLIIGLDTLGLDGYLNTIQYFVDTDIDLNKIKYIIPTGYHPIKLAPNKALKELKKQASAYTPDAQITIPVSDKSIVRNLQSEGISVFDNAEMPSKFHQKNRDEFKKELKKMFDGMDLE
ncbi:MAG: ParA family protein [Bacilli bacterium]|nr:ParA family protein [Bacilli bacterium]